MMTDHNSDPDVLARLLRAAGRREEPPDELYRRTLAAATGAWEHKVGVRRRRKLVWSIAASVVVGIGVFVVLERGRVSEPLTAGRIERVIGDAEARLTRDGAWAPVGQPATPLVAGAAIRTGTAGLVGVMLANGASLRIAPATQIAFDSPTRMHLVTGRVYLDSGPEVSARQYIEIATRAGIARDIGTQFEVQYVEDTYRVRVREGRVDIRRADGQIASAAGDVVRIDAAGAVTRERIARDDPAWRWTEKLAPAPRIDGKPVSVLLAWVARETGRPLRFEPPDIEQRARHVILHGDISSLAPLEALAAMLETTDFAHTLLDDGTIVIRSRGAE